LIGVLIAAAARWLSPGGLWLRRLPAHPLPAADQWLALEGRMAVEPAPGGERLVVVAQRLRPIPRPARPLEP
jgi:hypothetical protein